MIDNDKIGQTSAESDNVTDNIVKVACSMNVYKGDKFILVTYDPTKLQPIRGHPFLVVKSPPWPGKRTTDGQGIPPLQTYEGLTETDRTQGTDGNN